VATSNADFADPRLYGSALHRRAEGRRQRRIRLQADTNCSRSWPPNTPSDQPTKPFLAALTAAKCIIPSHARTDDRRHRANDYSERSQRCGCVVACGGRQERTGWGGTIDDGKYGGGREGYIEGYAVSAGARVLRAPRVHDAGGVEFMDVGIPTRGESTPAPSSPNRCGVKVY
jgi:hypothetical protein